MRNIEAPYYVCCVYPLLNSLLVVPLGGYGRFAALKTYNKELKTMLAIGGWNEGSKRFSPLVEDPVRRRTFIRLVHDDEFFLEKEI
jgi:GH18 family chitinase